MSTALTAAIIALVIGFVLLIADVEERVGWLLVVIGAIGAFVILIVGVVHGGTRR